MKLSFGSLAATNMLVGRISLAMMLPLCCVHALFDNMAETTTKDDEPPPFFDTTERDMGVTRPVTFYAMGDAPYSFTERKDLDEQIANMDNKVDFAIHLGDMQDRTKKCHRHVYKDVAEALNASEIPMFIIPGDNDYYDCANWKNGLQHWLDYFVKFDDGWEKPFHVRRQAARPENFAFTFQNVLFVGIHTLGTGKIKSGKEWRRLENANLQWTRNQFYNWGNIVQAVVIFSHSYTRKTLYTKYWDGLSDLAEQYSHLPILFLQGDAHRWEMDTPFRTDRILRVIVERGGREDPVMVTVDPTAKKTFSFQRRPLSGM